MKNAPMPSMTSSTPRLISPMSVENNSRHASKDGSFAVVDAASLGISPRIGLTAIKAGPRRAFRGRLLVAVGMLLAVAACGRVAPPTAAPPTTRAAPAAPAATAAVAAPAPHKVALPAADPPPGPLYTCERTGTREPLVLSESVDRLCRRHPEMGPCQYERDQCRKGGGRVLTARNEEVTPAVEAEYDKRVTRVRLQADGGPPKR
jgi:hypothetical protein